jgi:hypothetical protein
MTKEASLEDKRATVQHGLQVSDSMMRSAGIYLGYADNKGKVTNAKAYDDFRAQFQSSLLQEMERFQADNKKKPTDDEITKMADRLLLQGRVRGTGYFSDDKTVAFQQRAAEGSPEFYVRYSDIPAERRSVVETKLKAAGKPADKAAVERAYTAWRLAGNR